MVLLAAAPLDRLFVHSGGEDERDRQLLDDLGLSGVRSHLVQLQMKTAGKPSSLITNEAVCSPENLKSVKSDLSLKDRYRYTQKGWLFVFIAGRNTVIDEVQGVTVIFELLLNNLWELVLEANNNVKMFILMKCVV